MRAWSLGVRLLFYITVLLGMFVLIDVLMKGNLKYDEIWIHLIVRIVGIILLLPGILLEKDLYAQKKKKMEKEGIVGTANLSGQSKTYIVMLVFSTTGRLLDAEITTGSVADSCRMSRYVGLTMEEARQHAKSERSWSVDWTEEREAAILAALDDGEKNLQTFRARSAVLRNESGSNPHPPAEEVSDSLWEEEEF